MNEFVDARTGILCKTKWCGCNVFNMENETREAEKAITKKNIWREVKNKMKICIQCEYIHGGFSRL